jgi:hypothetical protein
MARFASKEAWTLRVRAQMPSPTAPGFAFASSSPHAGCGYREAARLPRLVTRWARPAPHVQLPLDEEVTIPAGTIIVRLTASCVWAPTHSSKSP